MPRGSTRWSASAKPSAVPVQSITTGAIHGRVIDAVTEAPLPGVTVWAASPSLIEPQTAITDEDGVYKITELLPGDYTVTFYTDTAKVERLRNEIAEGSFRSDSQKIAAKMIEQLG